MNPYSKVIFCFLVVSLPLIWVDIISIGNFKVKYVQFATMLILPLFFYRNFRRHYFSFLFANKLLIYVFCLLMFVNMLSDIINNYIIFSSYLIKNVVYFFYFTLFGGIISLRFSHPSFYRLILFSNFLMIICFILYSTISYMSVGNFFLSELISGFFRGDSNFIRFKVYRSMFNFGGENFDDDIAVNLLNSLLGAFIFSFFSTMYAKSQLRSRFSSIVYIVLICSFFIVVSALSRSNIMSFFFGYLIYFFWVIFSGNSFGFSKKTIPFFVFFLLAAVYLLAFFNESILNALSGVAGRLEQVETDGRWSLNYEATIAFSKNLLVGLGSETRLSDGHAVHNFILGSAYQAGIFGLIFSIIFYYILLKRLLQSRLFFYKNEFWVSSLMALPLFRTMFSGGAGTLTLIEWFCIAFFSVVFFNSKNVNGYDY